MTELEQLKAQRRELDKRIKELTNPRYDTDDASMYLKHYPARDDAWLIVLEEIDGTRESCMCGKTPARKQLVAAHTKGEALECLNYQINALIELRDLILSRDKKGED